jgi:hypothetical protein
MYSIKVYHHLENQVLDGQTHGDLIFFSIWPDQVEKYDLQHLKKIVAT